MSSPDEEFMRLALAQAEQAARQDEVPVGAVVVADGVVVGSGFNQRESRQNPLYHAEIAAIDAAAKRLGRWRLSDCAIYVTLEPCIMCVGAILQARFAKLVFGCPDPKAGAVESLYRLCEDRRLNHQLPVIGGVLANEAGAVLSEFFTHLRTRKRELKIGERWPSG
jgi:tRNA(adenine34) deaminase